MKIAILSTAFLAQSIFSKRFIVQFKDNPSLERIPGWIKVHNKNNNVNYAVIDCDEKDLKGLSGIKYYEEDTECFFTEVQQNSPSWGLPNVSNSSPDYKYPSVAGDINVYVIDSGVDYNHPDFEGRASLGVNVSGDGEDTDCVGHGTHVAGTVGSATYGVNKYANIIGVKLSSCITGLFYTSNVIDGIYWAITHHNANSGGKKSVINMSLGTGAPSGINQLLQDAVTAAKNAGILVVIGGGNKGADACTYMYSAMTDALKVGATYFDTFDSVYSNSNYGTCIDILAPGGQILSLSPNGGTSTKSGTSMSAPHVAGVASLLAMYCDYSSTQDLMDAVVNRARQNVVSSVPAGTPNKLLFSDDTFLSCPGFPVIDKTSDFVGRYYNIDVLDTSIGCIHQPLSLTDGTAPTTSGCTENTDNIYEFVDFDNGIQIRHINDNKCLYVEAGTDILKSWECNADSNMEFDVIETSHGLTVRHNVSGLCLDEVSGVLKGVNCNTRFAYTNELLDEVEPFFFSPLNTIVLSSFKNIRIKEDGGVAFDTTIDEGSYSNTGFASKVSQELTDRSAQAGLSRAYTVTYDVYNNKFTISVNTGTVQVIVVPGQISLEMGFTVDSADASSVTSDSSSTIFTFSEIYSDIRFNHLPNDSVYVQNSFSSLMADILPRVTEDTFKFVDAGDNTFRIQSLSLGECAYIDATTNDLHFWSCWDDPNMKFYLYKYHDGVYRVTHAQSGLCLTGDSTNVWGTECGTSDVFEDEMSILEVYDNINSSYTTETYNVKLGGMCLNIVSGDFEACSGHSDQDIIFEDNGAGLETVDIKSPLIDTCLYVNPNTNQVYTSTCTSSSDMYFEIIQINLYNSSDIKIRHKNSGLCLAYSGSAGDAVILDCDGEDEYVVTFVVQ